MKKFDYISEIESIKAELQDIKVRVDTEIDKKIDMYSRIQDHSKTVCTQSVKTELIDLRLKITKDKHTQV